MKRSCVVCKGYRKAHSWLRVKDRDVCSKLCANARLVHFEYRLKRQKNVLSVLIQEKFERIEELKGEIVILERRIKLLDS